MSTNEKIENLQKTQGPCPSGGPASTHRFAAFVSEHCSCSRFDYFRSATGWFYIYTMVSTRCSENPWSGKPGKNMGSLFCVGTDRQRHVKDIWYRKFVLFAWRARHLRPVFGKPFCEGPPQTVENETGNQKTRSFGGGQRMHPQLRPTC